MQKKTEEEKLNDLSVLYLYGDYALEQPIPIFKLSVPQFFVFFFSSRITKRISSYWNKNKVQ